jgi:predicted negative regulator of RcsB-dependent stress response
MSQPVAPPSRGPSAEETVVEWFQRNARTLTITVAVLAVAAGAYWFYARSVELKNQNAGTALNTALQSVQAGNKALATSDLQKVVDRYGDTQAGIEAGLLLAQLDFNDGKIADGVNVLTSLTAKSSAKLDMSSIYGLMGDGQMQGNKPGEAAKSYQTAAADAQSDADRSLQLAKVARAQLAAGDTAAAAAVWQKLAADPKAQGVAAEARVRLGEIEAKAAKG